MPFGCGYGRDAACPLSVSCARPQWSHPNMALVIAPGSGQESHTVSRWPCWAPQVTQVWWPGVAQAGHPSLEFFERLIQKHLVPSRGRGGPFLGLAVRGGVSGLWMTRARGGVERLLGEMEMNSCQLFILAALTSNNLLV